MAISPMTRAEPDTIASSADYNTVLDNVEDIDSRVQPLEAARAWPKLRALRTTSVPAFTGGYDVVFQSYPTNKGGWTYAGGNTQLVCPQAGLYKFTVSVSWDASTSPNLGIYVCKNGNSGRVHGVGGFEVPAGTGEQNPRSMSGVVDLIAGDFLLLRCWSESVATGIRGTTSTEPYGGTYLFVERSE